MFDYIKGLVEYVDDTHIVIECNDIGYKFLASTSTISELSSKNDKVVIYTELVVREDSISLCGFASRNELALFKLLTSISGVGTKVGMGILSSFHYEELFTIIASEDAKSLVRANGVGKKTAERIILELKDKIKKIMPLIVSNSELIDKFNVAGQEFKDAKDALLSLGYTANEIKNTINTLNTKGFTTEEIIKFALKNLISL